MSKSRLIVSASLIALALGASAASAQNTPATPVPTPDPSTASPPATAKADNDASATAVETVVVTGLRQSVMSAQRIKRNSDQVVDSIVAEDIGKLPDDNVAEALQRVTGVQITRNADEGASVLIRGLPNVVTLLNGRELFTTIGRYVALADVPAAFLQRVDTYKSNAADQLEGGIAGTIDVRLHRPFDFTGSEVSATGRMIYSDLSHRYDPNIGLLVSDRWNTGAGDIGVLFGVSYQERHYRNEVIDNFVATPLGNATYTGSGPAPTGPVFISDNIGQQLTQGDRRRPAANFAIQWRPNSDFELYGEGFYTQDRNTSSTRFLVGLPRLGINMGYTLYPGTNEVKTLTSVVPFSISSTQAFDIDSTTYQLATGGSWTHGALKITGDLAYTNSTFDTRTAILDTSFIAPNATADTNYHNSGTPYVNYTGINLTNASTFSLFQLFDDHGRDVGQSTTARIDGVYTVDNGIIKSIEAGFRYGYRQAESNSTNPSSTFYPFQGINASSVAGLESVSPGGFFQGDAAVGVPRFAGPSPTFLLDDTDILRKLAGYEGPKPYDPTRFFGDVEKTYAGYVQAKANFLVGPLPIDAVGGVRLVETDQLLNGFNQVTVAVPVTPPTNPPTTKTTTTVTPLAASKSNFDVLPSLNLKANLRQDLIARFAANRTITRPDFSALNPAVSITSPGPTLLGTGGGGNPNLNEIKSNNYDFALEWYFQRTGALTATAFYRDLQGYIQYYAANELIGGSTYSVTRPRNTGSGSLMGMEVGYTQFYDFVPDYLKGIGLQLNFTYIDGFTQSPGATPTTFGPDQALVQVSRYSTNAIGLYERGPYSARIAYNWRSKYTDSYNNSGAPGSLQPGNVVVAPLQYMDMSFGYHFTPKMTLTFDWVNALGTVYHDSFGGSKIFPRDTRRFDETFELGFRWTL